MELRPTIIGHINSSHMLVLASVLGSTKFIVHQKKVRTKTIRDQLRSSRNIQGFAVIYLHCFKLNIVTEINVGWMDVKKDSF